MGNAGFLFLKGEPRLAGDNEPILAIGQTEQCPQTPPSPQHPGLFPFFLEKTSLHSAANQLTVPLPFPILLEQMTEAPVAQLDRAMAYGAIGWGFESLQA